MSLLREKTEIVSISIWEREHQEGGKVAFPQNQQGCGKEGGNG